MRQLEIFVIRLNGENALSTTVDRAGWTLRLGSLSLIILLGDKRKHCLIHAGFFGQVFLIRDAYSFVNIPILKVVPVDRRPEMLLLHKHLYSDIDRPPEAH